MKAPRVVIVVLSAKLALASFAAEQGSVKPVKERVVGDFIPMVAGDATPGRIGIAQPTVGLSTSLEEKYVWLFRRFGFSKDAKRAFMDLAAYRNRGGFERLSRAEVERTLSQIEKVFDRPTAHAVLVIENTHRYQPLLDAIALAAMKGSTPFYVHQAEKLLDAFHEQIVARPSHGLDAEAVTRAASTFLPEAHLKILRQELAKL